ncbi:hypothetical protein PPL_06243 [Heterostelium album PN500]|uniref:Ribosomal RNA-processing protein 43 n=1 Tax=Heterostelium pallidum (strain ATCC 26659 / Pp 5 / PN500) TaxID=670386 RepID=D3BCL8_HETP5|nr:hypothetical protein PPL_06243 [Heterostelium album PN500]EFA80660.1 hypothetical protein PPL_06243 [Heterostelium album PN500]|eukprot:XP_020432780.1 hypothetical protein PPL_06243 [Heterostelium album PN500]
MEAFQKIHPLEFYRKFLERSVRPDGRSLQRIRNTTVSAGSILTADGSSFVKIGNTSVICGVRAEIAEKQQDQTTSNTCKSQIIVNIEMGPICSNIFSSTKPSEKAMSLCTQLNQLVQLLDIDPKQLYFDVDGKYLWYLYVDLYCLDYNGNILDAAIIAMLSALKNVKLPKGVVSDDGSEVYKEEDTMRTLIINSYLIPLSFAVIDEYVLSDPSLEEEKLSNGSISIVYNEKRELCLQLYSGITPLDEKTLQQCLDQTKQRTQEIKDLIDQSINDSKDK